MDTAYQRPIKAGFKAYFIAGFADYAIYAVFAQTHKNGGPPTYNSDSVSSTRFQMGMSGLRLSGDTTGAAQ